MKSCSSIIRFLNEELRIMNKNIEGFRTLLYLLYLHWMKAKLTLIQ